MPLCELIFQKYSSDRGLSHLFLFTCLSFIYLLYLIHRTLACPSFLRKEIYMKLNPECIRSILLFVEDNVDFSHILTYSSDDIPESLSCYSHDEIVYHISQCKQSNLLDFLLMSSSLVLVLSFSPPGYLVFNFGNFLSYFKSKKISMGFSI